MHRQVHGYVLTADNATLRRKLEEADRIEGYNGHPGLDERNHYGREVAEVTMAGGKSVRAYVYHRPPTGAPRVASGDWYAR